MAKKDRKKCRFSPLFQTQKRSTVTACVVVAVLPIFYALILFYPGRKERMDVRSRRRCGNVYNWPYYGAVGNGVYRMWESPGFSMCCECVFHRWNGLLCTLGQFTRNYTQTVKRAADNKRRYAPGEGSIPPVLLSGVSKGVPPLAHDFACKV